MAHQAMAIEAKKLLRQLFLLPAPLSSAKISPIHVIYFHFQKWAFCDISTALHCKVSLLFTANGGIPVHS
jgi:hypothetical protein